VRYRLKKIAESLDYDPSEPRDAMIIHLAIILGKIAEKPAPRKPSSTV
jgi:DNA-binding PucR family transcriptional regulator